MNPLFYVGVKLRTRSELRKQGYGFFEINDIMRGADNEVVDYALQQACVNTGESLEVALGDGSILAWITKFLESPLGKALISALLGALLGGV